MYWYEIPPELSESDSYELLFEYREQLRLEKETLLSLLKSQKFSLIPDFSTIIFWIDDWIDPIEF